MPILLKRLKKIGVRMKRVKVVVATGSHRKQTAEEIVNRARFILPTSIHVEVHDCLDKGRLRLLGSTTFGTPIWVNESVAHAERRIGIGVIHPHVWAGYTGGGKIVLPGISSWESIGRNHFMAISEKSGLGILEGNPVREDADQAAKLVGLDMIANFAMDNERRIIDISAGDPVAAHRKGAEMASRIYEHRLKDSADILIAGYGRSNDTLHSILDAAALMKMAQQATRNDGTVVLVAPCNNGLFGRGIGHLHHDGSISDKELIDHLTSGAAPEDFLSMAARGEISYPELAVKGYLISQMAKEKNVLVVSNLRNNDVEWLGKHVRTASEALEKALQSEGKDAKVVVVPRLDTKAFVRKTRSRRALLGYIKRHFDVCMRALLLLTSLPLPPPQPISNLRALKKGSSIRTVYPFK